jgi:SAM-dependent methyltransferase
MASEDMEHSEDLAATAQFFDRAIGELAGFARAGRVRVLDFGCGAGELVGHLLALGYDAHGCDIVLASDAPGIAAAPQRFKQIARAPYRLPYDDASFDV